MGIGTNDSTVTLTAMYPPGQPLGGTIASYKLVTHAVRDAANPGHVSIDATFYLDVTRPMTLQMDADACTREIRSTCQDAEDERVLTVAPGDARPLRLHFAFNLADPVHTVTVTAFDLNQGAGFAQTVHVIDEH